MADEEEGEAAEETTEPQESSTPPADDSNAGGDSSKPVDKETTTKDGEILSESEIDEDGFRKVRRKRKKKKKKKKKQEDWPAVPYEFVPCPHLHYKADILERDALSRNQHTQLLATPKGYRWEPDKELRYISKVKGGKGGGGVAKKKKGKKKLKRAQKRTGKDDKEYIGHFLSEIWKSLPPKMLDQLRQLLIEEFGMSEEEADEFIKEQKEGACAETKAGKKRRKKPYGPPDVKVGVRHKWVKDFSRIFASKITDYIVMMLSCRRTPRVRKLAEAILNHFCHITGEKTTLNTPKTQVQRIMVFVADRVAIWLDSFMKESEEKSTKDESIEAKLSVPSPEPGKKPKKPSSKDDEEDEGDEEKPKSEPGSPRSKPPSKGGSKEPSPPGSKPSSKPPSGGSSKPSSKPPSKPSSKGSSKGGSKPPSTKSSKDQMGEGEAPGPKTDEGKGDAEEPKEAPEEEAEEEEEGGGGEEDVAVEDEEEGAEAEEEEEEEVEEGEEIDKEKPPVELPEDHKVRDIPPVLPPPLKGERSLVYQIAKGDGSYFNVRQLSSGTVAEKVAEARMREKPERTQKETQLTDSPLNLLTMKEWADWANKATDIAQEWSKWVDKTVHEAEEKAKARKGEKVGEDGQPQKLTKEEWRKWQAKTKFEEEEILKTKAQLKREAEMWKTKIDKAAEKMEPEKETNITDLGDNTKAPEGPLKAPEGPLKAPEGPLKAPEGLLKAPEGQDVNQEESKLAAIEEEEEEAPPEEAVKEEDEEANAEE